jgi:hypothetical protein
MKYLARASVLLLLGITSGSCQSEEAPECAPEEVEAHVLEQFNLYGPLSRKREYFGFIYRLDGVIASATTRGNICRWNQPCEVNTRRAADKIPAGAKVLGEWHTHPHEAGSQLLSDADVRGANDNRHIRCYRAFFSTASGEILSWEPNNLIVSVAMATAVKMGNYRRPAGDGSRYANTGR